MIHINYNKRNVNIISFIISIITFIIIILILDNLSQRQLNQFSYVNIISEKEIQKEEVEKDNLENKRQKINQDIKLEEIYKWNIEIEKLNINTTIQEGTTYEVLNQSVGHVEESNILNGIVALKAYNIGKGINYFANLKELIIGDEIKYEVNEEKRTYKVEENIILNKEKIKDKIQKIEKENNFLVLITYVKDMENKNRLVIAKEK